MPVPSLLRMSRFVALLCMVCARYVSYVKGQARSGSRVRIPEHRRASWRPAADGCTTPQKTRADPPAPSDEATMYTMPAATAVHPDHLDPHLEALRRLVEQADTTVEVLPCGDAIWIATARRDGAYIDAAADLRPLTGC